MIWDCRESFENIWASLGSSLGSFLETSETTCHLGASGIIWGEDEGESVIIRDHLVSSLGSWEHGTIWDHLGSSPASPRKSPLGSFTGSSGIWDHLKASGVIWCHLEPSELALGSPLGSSGVLWRGPVALAPEGCWKQRSATTLN